MTTNAAATGFWSAQQRNNARQGRALLQALFLAGAAASPLTATRAGVIPTNGDQTMGYDGFASVVSGQTINVAPFVGVASRPGQGPYLGWLLPTSVNVTCDSPPATNPRNDLIVMRIYDAAQGDTVPASGPCQIEVITGSPAASPTDPVTPDSTGTITNWATAPVSSQAAGGGVGIPLWRARVTTGGAVTLTDIRRSTGLLGGVRALLPGDSLSDPSRMPGDIRWYNGLDYWDGTNWNELGRPRIGGEVKASAQQSLAVNIGNKLQFGTVVKAPTGIGWNNLDTWTIQTDGIYSAFCNLRANGAPISGGISLGLTTYNDATLVLPPSGFTSVWGDYNLSGTVFLTAGMQVCFWYYNAGGNTTTNFATRPPMAKLWRVG